MTDYNKEFPFEQVSRMDSDGNCCGDYANSPHELMKLGYAESQICQCRTVTKRSSKKMVGD